MHSKELFFILVDLVETGSGGHDVSDPGFLLGQVG